MNLEYANGSGRPGPLVFSSQIHGAAKSNNPHARLMKIVRENQIEV